MKNQVVLGIDPSTVSTGWAVLIDQEIVDYGIIKCSSKDPIYIRVSNIFTSLVAVSQKHPITEIAIEDQFMRNNAKTLKSLSNVKATAMILAAQLNVPYTEYSPKHVKLKFTGSGGASKQDMVTHAKSMYDIEEDICDNIADAIGIATIHSHREDTT